MDDESTTPVAPGEEALTPTERKRTRFVDGIDGFSDRELIKQIHLTGTANRSGQEFELQRRFVERITDSLDSGTRVARLLFYGTVVLGLATIALVIATWRLGSGG